jgi:hypothetical protein
MGIVLYLGGCGICGAGVAWLRTRGVPFAGGAPAPLVADEG